MCIQYFKSRLSSGSMVDFCTVLLQYNFFFKEYFHEHYYKINWHITHNYFHFEFLHKPNLGELNLRVRTHRVAIATFWRTFHHDGISLVW